jgi:RHS repeat-associated protein
LSAFSRSRFTGKERDTESGNDYFEARYYGSSMGRMLSPDLLGGSLANPQSLNKYAYALNNPLVVTDPTGLYACKDDAKDATEHCTSDQDKSFEAARQRDLKLGGDAGRAAGAYGDPGAVNGVSVGFADLGKSGEDGKVVSSLGTDANGNLQAQSDVTINSKGRWPGHKIIKNRCAPFIHSFIVDEWETTNLDSILYMRTDFDNGRP